MTIEEKEAIVKGLKGQVVGIHIAGQYVEYTLKAHRTPHDRRMVVVDLERTLNGAPETMTVNATLLFVTQGSGDRNPIYGDSI